MNPSYKSCRANINYDLETDHRGSGYIETEVNCRLEIEYSSGDNFLNKSDSSSKSEYTDLYKNDSESENIDFNFSFSADNEVRKVKISNYQCEIDDVSLY